MQLSGYGLPRIHLPRTPVHKDEKIRHLSDVYIVVGPYDALVYKGKHLFGARQRKDEIVGTTAEPRKDAVWRVSPVLGRTILPSHMREVLLGPSCSCPDTPRLCPRGLSRSSPLSRCAWGPVLWQLPPP
jgi:hypothetical protein